MGQYYKIVNPAKRQYLNPSEFGDMLKLGAFGNSQYGTMFALSVLLASGNGEGGGDLNSSSPLIGSWAGDRIYILGDYSDEIVVIDGVENPKGHTLNTMLHMKKYKFKDISQKIIAVIAQSDPNHPLAVIAQQNLYDKKSNFKNRPSSWGVATVMNEPHEKSILSFTQLMQVIDAKIGESDDITGDNFVWKIQCLYGLFNNMGQNIKNTNGARMVMKSFDKQMAKFLPQQYYWTDQFRDQYDSIGFVGVGKQYVKSLNFTITNDKTHLDYQFELHFPCSILDLKPILEQVMEKCEPQTEALVLGNQESPTLKMKM